MTRRSLDLPYESGPYPPKGGWRVFLLIALSLGAWAAIILIGIGLFT